MAYNPQNPNGQTTAAGSTPIVSNVETASGTITILNSTPTGAATAGSAVEMTLNGASAMSIQVTGTYTGALSLQFTNDNSTWVTVTATSIINSISGANAATIASGTQGVFSFNCQGFLKVRVTALAAVTGTATITLRSTNSSSLVALSQALPTGSNIIGAVSGAAAVSAATSGNPVYIAGKTLQTTTATVETTLVAGDVAALPITSGQQMAVKPFGTAELDITTNFSSVGTTVTVQPLIPASGTASVRNYIASLTLATDTMGAAGLVWVLDGSLTVSSIAITTGLVTTSAAHDLQVGQSVVFTSLASGTGVTANTVYYVTAVGSTTTFNFSATIGGSNVVPSVAYTGTTMYRILYQTKLQTTGCPTPVTINFNTPLRGNSNMITNFLIPSSLTSGTIYLSANGFRGF